MSAVLVTGAAGGLGSALVGALVERGERVVAIDRAPIERGDVAAYAIDLADEDAVTVALADAAGRGLAIQHVVAIAGAALPEEKTGADLAELPLAVFRASLELNLVTAWITLRAALLTCGAPAGIARSRSRRRPTRSRATGCRPTRPPRRA